MRCMTIALEVVIGGVPPDLKVLVLSEGLVVGCGDVWLALHVAQLIQNMAEGLKAEEVLVFHRIPQVYMPVSSTKACSDINPVPTVYGTA